MGGVVEGDRDIASGADCRAVEKHPRECAALAYLLETSGIPVKGVYPTKGSELEKTINAEGQAWLKA